MVPKTLASSSAVVIAAPLVKMPFPSLRLADGQTLLLARRNAVDDSFRSQLMQL
jgi:hypothetical protein